MPRLWRRFLSIVTSKDKVPFLMTAQISIVHVHIIATVHKSLRKSLCWQYDFFSVNVFVWVFFLSFKAIFFRLVRDLTCVLQWLSWTSQLFFKYACQNLIYLHLHYLLLSHWFFFRIYLRTVDIRQKN